MDFAEPAPKAVTDRDPFDADDDADPRSPASKTRTRRGEPRVRDPGIASRIKAWFPASVSAIASNYAAAASLILLGDGLYAIVPHATEMTRAYYDGVLPQAELGSPPDRRRRVSAAAPALLRDILR